MNGIILFVRLRGDGVFRVGGSPEYAILSLKVSDRWWLQVAFFILFGKWKPGSGAIASGGEPGKSIRYPLNGSRLGILGTDDGPYRLPNGGNEFHRENVLNHRVGPSCVIQSGAKLDGIFLGIATSTIPRYFPCGMKMPVEILIVDQFGTKHWSGVDILVDRTATAPPQRLAPRRSTLYDPVGYEVFNTKRPLPRANSVVPNSPTGFAVPLNNEKE